MKKKILIFTPSYQENTGGVVVLHKLCSILNQIGYESFLYPYFDSHILHKHNYKKSMLSFIDSNIRSFVRGFKTNPNFQTPTVYTTKQIDWDEWIVIYPEIVMGNPLGAKNIIRWLLHNPGFHTNTVFYGRGELYFKYSSGISDFDYTGSTTSKQYLKVINYPLELYNNENISSERSGTAYLLYKGKGKEIQHDLKNSILIDGKSHKEVSEIFKKVKTFISYDPMTAYSRFAVLCGCQSIVIPDEGVSIDEWYPDSKDRYGISYGFSNLEEANSTKNLLEPLVIKEHESSIENVRKAFNEADSHFE